MLARLRLNLKRFRESAWPSRLILALGFVFVASALATLLTDGATELWLRSIAMACLAGIALSGALAWRFGRDANAPK